MEEMKTFWNRKSPLYPVSSDLLARLVPGRATPLTRHAELLQLWTQVYYRRNNDGFGCGPFNAAVKALEHSRPAVLNFISERDLNAFMYDFECAGYGAEHVDNEWEGDEGLEKLLGAIVQATAAAEEVNPTPYADVDEVLADLRSDDPGRSKVAAQYLDVAFEHDSIHPEHLTRLSIAAFQALYKFADKSDVKQILDNYCDLQGISLKNPDQVSDAVKDAVDNILPGIVHEHGVIDHRGDNSQD